MDDDVSRFGLLYAICDGRKPSPRQGERGDVERLVLNFRMHGCHPWGFVVPLCSGSLFGPLPAEIGQRASNPGEGVDVEFDVISIRRNCCDLSRKVEGGM